MPPPTMIVRMPLSRTSPSWRYRTKEATANGLPGRGQRRQGARLGTGTESAARRRYSRRKQPGAASSDMRDRSTQTPTTRRWWPWCPLGAGAALASLAGVALLVAAPAVPRISREVHARLSARHERGRTTRDARSLGAQRRGRGANVVAGTAVGLIVLQVEADAAAGAKRRVACVDADARLAGLKQAACVATRTTVADILREVDAATVAGNQAGGTGGCALIVRAQRRRAATHRSAVPTVGGILLGVGAGGAADVALHAALWHDAQVDAGHADLAGGAGLGWGAWRLAARPRAAAGRCKEEEDDCQERIPGGGHCRYRENRSRGRAHG
jgi:hypothetical protein